MTASFAVTVRQPFVTTTTLTSSRNPSKVGEPVTFTATVAATGTALLPTGNVVFSEGTTTLATVPLTGAAQATFTTSSLTAGSHIITATYQGNASFNSSATSLTQVETALPKPKPVVADEDDEAEEDTSRSDLARICRPYLRSFIGLGDPVATDGDGDGDRWNRRRRLREICAQWFRHNNDLVTVIDRGHRRAIEGYFDRGGGHREFWDQRKQRWVPMHHHKVHKHYAPPPPPKRPMPHFAVTG
ncbi:hypothetical protein Sru01_43120 [Sphaerisporangium rufum]|uniref:Bacterial Ig-like domain-containing protein n=1 Tax=Sphaerisporangium rufum TaxID=1381558 RepID=A0A919R6U0_9ACTN|nr:Ig-like domain-containing protein [Sphaerisporangium rufum]GII79330.1 hypothetical protein Sru01_43120 [Sphaerisporangium rufum]